MAVYKKAKDNKSENESKGLRSPFPDKSKQSTYINVVIRVYILLDVIVIPLVALIGYFSYHDIYHILPLFENEHITEFSVYCDDLSLGPDDDSETFDTKKNDLTVFVNEDGRYICKYKSRYMTETIQKVVDRQSMLRIARGLESRQYLSCGNESLASKSGHLTFAFSGVSRHQKYQGKRLDSTLHWDKHLDRSYVAAVIPYHNGEITIPEGRTYYIYASVHFNISRGDNNDNSGRPRTFTLRICRKVYGYEQTLLGKTQLFNASNGNVVSSLNVGSYLQMSRNDVIYVKVSHANSIIRESRGNTFAMFPLST